MYNLGLSARVLPFDDNIKHEDGVDFLKKTVTTIPAISMPS
jgi:hypothetical protein